MWIRIRAVIIEDEPLASQYLAKLLDETCQVEVVGSATESEAGLRLCAELRPDVVFVDIGLPGKDGVSLATQLAMLPQPPRLVFTTGNANPSTVTWDRLWQTGWATRSSFQTTWRRSGRSCRRGLCATDACRLEAVDYLLKPLDPEQVTEAVYRLLTYLRPFEVASSPGSGGHANRVPTTDKMRSTGMANELLPVKDMDRDQIRLLARREVVAVLRRERRTWVHSVREEFATYYPVADLLRWLGGDPFVQIGRHAVVNLQAIERVIHYGDRLYRVRLRDRVGTEITASRTGAARLAAVLNTGTLKEGTRATSYTDL
jgi:two-component system, LytTR family, response regulator LytT